MQVPAYVTAGLLLVAGCGIDNDAAELTWGYYRTMPAEQKALIDEELGEDDLKDLQVAAAAMGAEDSVALDGMRLEELIEKGEEIREETR